MAAADRNWKIEDHVCLTCFGRVVSRPGEDNRREFRCTNCGASGAGSVRTICACGMRVGTRDAGVRCVRNDNPRPDLPSEIIAKEIS